MNIYSCFTSTRWAAEKKAVWFLFRFNQIEMVHTARVLCWKCSFAHTAQATAAVFELYWPTKFLALHENSSMCFDSFIIVVPVRARFIHTRWFRCIGVCIYIGIAHITMALANKRIKWHIRAILAHHWATTLEYRHWMDICVSCIQMNMH